MLAVPPESVAVPSEVAPSKNSTEPLAAAGATVAVSVTLCPVTDGFGVLASEAVVVAWSVDAASLASVAGFPCTSSAVTRTRAVAEGLFGMVQLNVPEFASPLATGSQLEPLSTEYSSVIPPAAMPSGSVAVQVIACTEPWSQDSPPFGDVTATDGVVRSTFTVAVVPITEGSVAFEQSRSVTELIVTLPLPPVSVLPTATVNSVPLVAPEPQGEPSVTPSTVKVPPPLSVTWKLVERPLAARPWSQDSPPFGDVTATDGVVRSTFTVAVVPITEGSVAFEQSRSVTELIVTLPLPPVSVLPTEPWSQDSP